jgi:hypothetical protein
MSTWYPPTTYDPAAGTGQLLVNPPFSAMTSNPSTSRIKITARGWPWQQVGGHWSSAADKTKGQRYGWNPFVVKGAGRFGGWWAFKLGITISQSLRDWVFDLGIGSIRVVINEREPGDA